VIGAAIAWVEHLAGAGLAATSTDRPIDRHHTALASNDAKMWMLPCASPTWLQTTAQSGAELFEKELRRLHQTGIPTHAPAPEALRQLSRTKILAAVYALTFFNAAWIFLSRSWPSLESGIVFKASCARPQKTFILSGWSSLVRE